MAGKLYFDTSTIYGLRPSAPTGWQGYGAPRVDNSLGSKLRHDASPYPWAFGTRETPGPADSSSPIHVVAINPLATGGDTFRGVTFVSPPLAAQTFSGYCGMRAQIRSRESATGANFYPHWTVSLLNPDGTLKSVISNPGAPGVVGWAGSTELTTTLTNRTFPSGFTYTPGGVFSEYVLPSSLLAGERLLFEFGVYQDAATASAYSFEFDLANVSSDLPEGSTGATAGTPWIGFSQDVAFLTDSHSYDLPTISLEGSADGVTNVMGDQRKLWGEQTPEGQVIIPTDGLIWPRRG